MSLYKISGRVLKFFAAIAIVITVTLLSSNNSHAASFGHVHTDACYENVTKLCDKHYVRDTVGRHDYHCPGCGVFRSFVEIIYGDYCPNGLTRTTSLAYIQYCTVCGTYLRNETPGSPSSHYYTTRDLVCGMNESTPIANVSLNAVSGAPTNGSVTLSIDVSGTTSEFSLAGEPYNFGAGNTSNPSFEVTENGTYTASVTDSRGRSVSVSYTVDCIDKAAPVIDSVTKNTEDWSESGVIVTVEAHDEGLGLSDASYSFNGGAFGADNSYKVTSNGNLSIRVRDAAGNITETSYTVSNVGRDPKVVEAERREAERVAAEKAAKEKAEADRIAAEKAAAEKAAAEKAAKDKASKEKSTKEKTSGNKTVTDLSKNSGGKNSGKNGASTVSADESDKDAFGRFKDASAKGAIIAKGTFGRNPEGKLILVKDLTLAEKAEASHNFEEEVIESVDEFAADEAYSEDSVDDDIKKSSILEASVGGLTLPVGVLLLLTGAFFVSRFNYVYVVQGGRKRIVTKCRVIKSANGLTAIVPGDKLTSHGKYLLYISPWKKEFKKKVPVSVMLEGEETTIPTDEGVAFKY